MIQTTLRTSEIVPNENICFPIGTIVAVENIHDILNFPYIFGKHKKKGLDINSLIKALISYKLTDNFSIDRTHEWMNRDEVLGVYNLEEFHEKSPLGKYGYSRDHRPDKKTNYYRCQ